MNTVRIISYPGGYALEHIDSPCPEGSRFRLVTGRDLWPRTWKTRRGAERYAETHGYVLEEGRA